MNKMFTTAGNFYTQKADLSCQTGPSMSRQEQISRLTALKRVKGLSEKKQQKIGESIFD